MADACSRLWHLTDSQLLAYFNLHYPQAQSWQLVHLRPAMHSSLILALQMQRPDLESLLSEPPTRIVSGGSGNPLSPLLMGLTSTSTLSHHTSTYLFSKFLQRESAEAPLDPAVNLSSLNVYRTTYGPLPRRFEWGPSSDGTPGTLHTT